MCTRFIWVLQNWLPNRAALRYLLCYTRSLSSRSIVIKLSPQVWGTGNIGMCWNLWNLSSTRRSLGYWGHEVVTVWLLGSSHKTFIIKGTNCGSASLSFCSLFRLKSLAFSGTCSCHYYLDNKVMPGDALNTEFILDPLGSLNFRSVS